MLKHKNKLCTFVLNNVSINKLNIKYDKYINYTMKLL